MMEPESSQLRVPIAEERIVVDKRPCVIGEVLLRRTVSEERQAVAVDVRREVLRVSRRAVAARPASPAEIERAFMAGRQLIPVFGEYASASKKAFVTGEVVLRRRAALERRMVTETVRRQLVDAEVVETPGRAEEAPREVIEAPQEVIEAPREVVEARREVVAVPREIVSAPVEKLSTTWRQVLEGFNRGRSRI